MHEILLYIRAQSVKGVLVDSFNTTSTPTRVSILRGMEARLKLTLFKDGQSSDDASKYVLEDFESIAVWKFYADVDYDSLTPVKLVVDTENIEVNTDGSITIDLLNTNTLELANEIGKKETVDLIGELLGFELGESAPSFALHFPITIRNRVGLAGGSLPVPVPTLDEAVEAKLALMFADMTEPVTVDELFSTLTQVIQKFKGE